MASVIQVDGKWRVQVRRRGHKSQCKTFATKTAADTWGRQREAELDALDAGGPTATPALGPLTVREVLQAYRDLRDQAGRPIGDTTNEHYMLKALTTGLGEHRVDRLTPQHLVAYARQRADDGAGPYTINMDLSKLGTAFRYAGVALNRALPDVVGAARPLLSHLRLIGGGGKRERRPTEDELAAVLAAVEKKRGKVYAEAIRFAACSAMRRGEVCAFRWSEIDERTRLVSVLRKHPRKGKTLEQVPLLGEAWKIVQRQPVVDDDDRVFPIEAGTLSKYFTEACRALKIPDLHLHDMRHEGTSRMFEQGLEIQQVALVTGHKKWEHLKRYTNLKPEDLSKPRARAKR